MGGTSLYSRRVVGWAIDKTLSRRLAIKALKAAIATRTPPRGLIHHTDRGSQYSSREYQKVLSNHGLIASMSGKGNCYDNAVAESFFATLKKELVHRTVFYSRSHAYQAVFNFIELILPRFGGRFDYAARRWRMATVS